MALFVKEFSFNILLLIYMKQLTAYVLKPEKCLNDCYQ